jgi:steroid delta-isomerase-like uncharacterized protein
MLYASHNMCRRSAQRSPGPNEQFGARHNNIHRRVCYRIASLGPLTMSIDPYTLVHRWFEEVWNQGREETVDELLAPDGIIHGLGEGSIDVRGPAGFKVFLRNMRSAFPDVHIDIEDTIVQGGKAVVRVVLEGKHLGDGLGLPPTGQGVSIAGIVIVRVSGDQIAEGWNSWDQLGLLRMLGAIAPHGPDPFLSARP